MSKQLKIVLIVLILLGAGWMVSQDNKPVEVKSQFDVAVDIIKKYEGLHKASHWPLVGYGHKVLPTDKISRGKVLTEAEADKLLRSDLSKLCAMYRSFGPDSLLLATLAYNLGHGAVNRSTVYKKLAAGDRSIEQNYLSHCRYKGKVLSQLQRRRKEEFEKLFVTDEQLAAQQKIKIELEEEENVSHSEVRLPYTQAPEIKGQP